MSNSIIAEEKHLLREKQVRKELRIHRNAHRRSYQQVIPQPLHLSISKPPTPLRKLSTWQGMVAYINKMIGR